MKLSWLRCACAVAEHGSFTAAASVLGLRQPSVSGAIAALEEEVGAPLFVRSTRAVRLTQLGEHLLPSIRRVVDAELSLLEALELFQQPEAPLLRIGVSPIVDMGLLHAVLQPYCVQNPQVDVIFKDCFVGDMEERLGAGRLDLVVGVLIPRKQGRSRTLFYEEPLRFVPRHHTSTLSDQIELDDVCRQQVLMPVDACGLARTIEALLVGRTATIYPGRAMTYGVLAEWAELGIGGAMLPSRTVPEGGRFPVVQVEGQPVILKHEIAWERAHLRPHVQLAVEHFQRCVPSLVQGSAHQGTG